MGGSVGWLMLLGIDVIIVRLVKCLVKYYLVGSFGDVNKVVFYFFRLFDWGWLVFVMLCYMVGGLGVEVDGYLEFYGVIVWVWLG